MKWEVIIIFAHRRVERCVIGGDGGCGWVNRFCLLLWLVPWYFDLLV